MTQNNLFQVDVELKRVQTFIFEVPRLKAMLGANALVGETLRNDLYDLYERATEHQVSPITTADSEKIIQDADDPLNGKGEKFEDNPANLYKKGILVRDGGRFKAVFASKESANKFKVSAEDLLTQKLPGVLFDVDVKGFGDVKSSSGGRSAKAGELHVLDLPVLQICQETGHGVASENTANDKSDSTIWGAQSVKARLDAGSSFYDGKTNDIIGLIRDKLGLNSKGWANNRNWRDPNDLSDLANGSYLALIHADGNSVGKRYNEHIASYEDKPVEDREARGEMFFHSMRVAVRKSVVSALKTTFALDAEPTDKNEKIKTARPYEVLMLGGDDLLLACRADKALEFSKNYAIELKKYSLADGTPLDVGIGVAIAKPSYPFHRLHDLAEVLATSAKRLYRTDECNGSVIDWQVVTQSWFDDVATARQRADIREYSVDGEKSEKLILSARPYRIISTKDSRSLEEVLEAVKELDLEGETTKAARSPLRALRQAFESGRLSGEMAFSRLDENTQQILTGSEDKSPWNHESNKTYLTRLFDVIGVREISHLGRAQ